MSGMNSLEMIRDNAAQAEKAHPGCMTPEEHAFVEALRDDLQGSMRVGCTGCGYCQPCPAGVDIPGVFASYNTALPPRDAMRKSSICSQQDCGAKVPEPASAWHAGNVNSIAPNTCPSASC